MSAHTVRERWGLSGRRLALLGHLAVQVLEVAATVRVLLGVRSRLRAIDRDEARARAAREVATR